MKKTGKHLGRHNRFPKYIDVTVDPGLPDKLSKAARMAFSAEVGRESPKGFVLFENHERSNPYAVYRSFRAGDDSALASMLSDKRGDLHRAVAKAPDDAAKAVALNNLGCFLFHWKEDGAAFECLEQAVALDGDNTVVKHNRNYLSGLLMSEAYQDFRIA